MRKISFTFRLLSFFKLLYRSLKAARNRESPSDFPIVPGA
jgi:hypothetical protein